MSARSAGAVLLLLVAIGGGGYWLGSRSQAPSMSSATLPPDRIDASARDPADPANEAPLRVGDRVEALSAEGWEAASVAGIDGEQARVDYDRSDLADESLDLRLLRPEVAGNLPTTPPSALSTAPTNSADGTAQVDESQGAAGTNQPPATTCAPAPFERTQLNRVPPPDTADELVAVLRHTLECPQLEPRLRADGFASMSLAVVRSRPDPACAGFRPGMLDGRWEAHRDWALQQDPASIGADLAAKVMTAWDCGLRSEGARYVLHGELLALLDATVAGHVERMPDFVEDAGEGEGGIEVSVEGEYLGCFRDTSDLDLSGHLERSAQNTPQGCVATCLGLGYVYAAVQYGESCLCGDSYGRYGKADNCDYACTGDPAQTCGGYSANAVYATGVTMPNPH